MGDFRSVSHSSAPLENWVDKLLSIKDDQRKKEGKSSSLDSLSAQRQRYHVVFEELARQTAVHSESLGRLLGKTWTGADGVTNKIQRGYEHAHARCTFLQVSSERPPSGGGRSSVAKRTMIGGGGGGGVRRLRSRCGRAERRAVRGDERSHARLAPRSRRRRPRASLSLPWLVRAVVRAP